MAVVNVAGDMKGRGKAGDHRTHDKEALEVDLVEIFRVQEQVWNAEIFSETARDHCKENYPAQEQNLVPLQVVQQELNREGISDLRSKKIKPSQHRQI